MIDPVLRALARLLFLQNIDASQITVEEEPIEAMWKNLLEEIQRNQTISTQPLKNALTLQSTTLTNMNPQLNQIIASLPKQLGNLFFSAQKCLCGELVKKFSFIVYDDKLTNPEKIHICEECKSAMQPITAPSILALVGNQYLHEVPCKLVSFGEEYILMDAFLLEGSELSSFLLNEAAISEKTVGKYGIPFGERDFGLRESQKLLFGSGIQGSVHAAFYCKLSQVDVQLQQRLLQNAELVDGEPNESMIGCPTSEPQSPEITNREEISIVPPAAESIPAQRTGGVVPQNVIRIGNSTVPVYLLISLMFLAFFAAFAFFGDIALFVEIAKTKKRVLALEGAPSV